MHSSLRPALSAWLLICAFSANAFHVQSTTYEVNGVSDHSPIFYEHALWKRDTETEEKLRKNKKASGTEKPDKGLKPTKLTKPGELSADQQPADVREDNHTYYKTITTFNNEQLTNTYWLPMAKLNESRRHDMLSSAHRRAATIRLSFKFPFYGHLIENITIATGGFMYLGEAIHTWLAATQYIAPLMANFNTSISNDSNIYYYDNGTAFSVQWENVYLQEGTNSSINSTTDKPFSFQATLHENGNIVFTYLKVPMPIDQIAEEKHPVKVGLSDAYIIERTMFIIRRKTIYEYHKAELKSFGITNNTVIRFEAMPTCIAIKDCNTCIKPNVTSFECTWCNTLQRCSDGYDRNRHIWLLKGCDDNNVEQKCLPKKDNQTSGNTFSNSATNSQWHGDEMPNTKKASSRAGFMPVFLLLALVSGLAFWSFYAYKNPQSSSGQFLIKYRPTQWRFGQTEAW